MSLVSLYHPYYREVQGKGYNRLCMDWRDVSLLVGLACAIGALFWIFGLMLGIKLRGTHIPYKGACGVTVGLYVAAIVALGVLALWKSPPVMRSENGLEPTDAATVTRIIDGDTIDVDGERVRILGIDTPEEGECYADKATAALAAMVDGRQVTLVADASQGDVDKYGRLLRYVEDADGTDAGLMLVAQGYAREYTYDAPHARQTAYRSAENAAQAQNLGLWGSCE